VVVGGGGNRERLTTRHAAVETLSLCFLFKKPPYLRREDWVSPLEYTGVSSWIAILPHVNDPVLSEHRIVIPARSSMAAKRLTMAPWWLSWWEPKARVVVHTISMATGMEATRSTTYHICLKKKAERRTKSQ
jgi:hypothetical protein